MEDLNNDLKRQPTTQSSGGDNQSKKLVRGALNNKNAANARATFFDKKNVILENASTNFNSKRLDTEPTATSSGHGSKNLTGTTHPSNVANKRTSYVPSTSSMMNFMKSGGQAAKKNESQGFVFKKAEK